MAFSVGYSPLALSAMSFGSAIADACAAQLGRWFFGLVALAISIGIALGYYLAQ